MASAQDRLNFDGFEAWIVVDSVTAPQYGIERAEGEQKVSCWIPSTTDKEFSISFCGKQEEKYAYTAKVLLDGQEMAHHLYLRDPLLRSPINVISTIRTSATEVRSFAFASLELTDDDTHLEDSSAQNIGDITVIIQRRTNPVVSPNQSSGTYSNPLSNGKVHERSKKGLAHQIKLGSVKTESKPRGIVYTSGLYGKPITFIFKYRPLAMLQATGIVPRMPSTSEKDSPQRPIATDGANKQKVSVVKTESDNEETDSDEDEAEDDEDDLAKERELLAELEKVRNRKRAKRGGNARSKKKVKTEPTTYFTPGEVIDLT